MRRFREKVCRRVGGSSLWLTNTLRAYSGHLLASLFSGKFSPLLLQVIFNDFLSTADRPGPAETRTGFGPLRVDADGPFPSGRISRLDDGVLNASEFHDPPICLLDSTPGGGFRSTNS